MENMYFEFRTEYEMKNIESNLKNKGYNLPFNDKKVTFQDIKNFYKRNKIYLVKAYYNTLNKKKEYIFTTKQIENRNKQRINFK